MKVCVIGTGQAGLAAAETLIDQGLRPVILDAGERLDGRIAARAEALAATDPAEWERRSVPFPAATRPNDGGLPRKSVFGSAFVFAQDRSPEPIHQVGADAALSLASGGFSLAWGGAVLPARDEDLDAWPASSWPSEADYTGAMASLPLVGDRDDDLAELFPSYAPHMRPMAPTPQGLALYDTLRRRRATLNRGDARVIVGRARLSLDAASCRHCGLCLVGCPFGAIHRLDRTLDGLCADGRIDYRPRTYVTHIEETPAGVSVFWRHLDRGDREHAMFDRVFLAAGTLGSTRIMLRSLAAFGRPVALLDSAKFALPLIALRSQPLAWPDATTLADLFIEALQPRLSRRWMHVQVSPLNDMLVERLRLGRGLSLNAAGRLARPLLARTMVAWCSLHSDLSTACRAALIDGPDGGVLEVRAGEDRSTSAVRAHGWWLARLGLRAGFAALPFAALTSTPGSTGHCGGTLPMRDRPRDLLETDPLGRPAGWRATHLIDASVFPSIPATTIALLIRANARRIVRQAAEVTI